MAKVTITLEDTSDGLRFECVPPVMEFIRDVRDRHSISNGTNHVSPAETFAMAALNPIVKMLAKLEKGV